MNTMSKEQRQEHLEGFTCGCGIYVHPKRCNRNAIHIPDCIYGQWIARSAVGGEAVAWRHWHGKENDGWEYYESAHCPDCQPLYTAPAAPANEALAKRLHEILDPVENYEGWQGVIFKELKATLGDKK
jgi:hypothetical protein